MHTNISVPSAARRETCGRVDVTATSGWVGMGRRGEGQGGAHSASKNPR